MVLPLPTFVSKAAGSKLGNTLFKLGHLRTGGAKPVLIVPALQAEYRANMDNSRIVWLKAANIDPFSPEFRLHQENHWLVSPRKLKTIVEMADGKFPPNGQNGPACHVRIMQNAVLNSLTA